MSNPEEHILRIGNLGVSYGGAQAVADVSLDVRPGEIVGLVGESGSGKSTVLRACCGLLGGGGRVSAGRIEFCGEDLSHADRNRLTSLRGAGMSYVFQDPVASLDPLFRIKDQFDECILAHRDLSKGELTKLEQDLLLQMGFDDPERVLGLYPFNLSGGMCQRVVLAMGLACNPRLLLADEPTSALDVTVQAQVVRMLRKINRERGIAILMVSHDIALVSALADRIGVMKDGALVEFGETKQILDNPRQPYTRLLIESVPKLRIADPAISHEEER